MQRIWLFSTPYSIVLFTNISIQVEPCFVLEKQTAQNINAFFKKKKTPSITEFLRHLQSTKLTQDGELAPNGKSNYGNVHCSGGERG
jgi:hypothetical protein